MNKNAKKLTMLLAMGKKMPHSPMPPTKNKKKSTKKGTKKTSPMMKGKC